MTMVRGRWRLSTLATMQRQAARGHWLLTPTRGWRSTWKVSERSTMDNHVQTVLMPMLFLLPGLILLIFCLAVNTDGVFTNGTIPNGYGVGPAMKYEYVTAMMKGKTRAQVRPLNKQDGCRLRTAK